MIKNAWNKYINFMNAKYTAFGLTGYLIVNLLFLFSAIVDAALGKVNSTWLMITFGFVVFEILRSNYVDNHHFYKD